MQEPVRLETVDRRDWLIGAGAAAAIIALFSGQALGQQDKPAPPPIDDAIAKILGGAKPTDSKLTLDVPEIAENGNTVPYTIVIENPMTERDYVKTLHVMGAGNPQPGIASYAFTPLSGKAAVSSRMRLAKTQDIVAIAELSDGKFLMAKRTIKVTIGGCGG